MTKRLSSLKDVRVTSSRMTPVVGAALMLLGGCSRLQVKLGARVDLSKLPVTTIEATLPQGAAIAPGQQSPLVVTLADPAVPVSAPGANPTQPAGAIFVTSGAGKGKVRWSDLSVVATVVSVNNKGVLTLPQDPRASDGKTGHVTITVPSHPGLVAQLDIPLRYDYQFVASYSGSNGSDGLNGSNGTAGLSGSVGSIGPDNPSPGGNGGNGTDGSNGGDGSNGSDGPAVQVMVTLRPGTHPLLQAGVLVAGHEERFYLVDPQGGSLTVNSSGGSGGSGGRGGSGGSGGSGGIGTPNGSDGQSGHSGRNGSDGSSASGGPITVTYDPQVQPYLSGIHVSNPRGPKPIFTEASVPPLW